MFLKIPFLNMFDGTNQVISLSIYIYIYLYIYIRYPIIYIYIYVSIYLIHFDRFFGAGLAEGSQRVALSLLSLELMEDPVIADGYTYERWILWNWMVWYGLIMCSPTLDAVMNRRISTKLDGFQSYQAKSGWLSVVSTQIWKLPQSLLGRDDLQVLYRAQFGFKEGESNDQGANPKFGTMDGRRLFTLYLAI